jgi:Mg2+ and Co2+ transporter CorA
VEDLGRNPLVAAFDLVLEDTANRVSTSWSYDWKTKLEAGMHGLGALGHRIGKLVYKQSGATRRETRLEKHADAVVTEALRQAMEKHNTQEVFERIHDRMRDAISVEFNDSLQRIRNELSSLEVRSQSGRQIRIFAFENRIAVQSDVVDETLDHLKNALFAGFGFSMGGGGAIYLDFVFAGGIVSAVLGSIAVVGILVEVFREYISVYEDDPDAKSLERLGELRRKVWADLKAKGDERRAAVERKFRRKLKAEIAKSRDAILAKAIDGPLRDYRSGLLAQYDKQVQDLLDSAAAQLERARKDIESGRDYHSKLKAEIGDVKGVLLDLEHRLRALMPESLA